jgi:hypothetical protein
MKMGSLTAMQVFFRTERAGLDTLVFIGGDFLRNPSLAEVDSLLKEWDKPDIDSVGFVSVTNDSTYVFPNYQLPKQFIRNQDCRRSATGK